MTEKSIFLNALAIESSQERAEFLDQACGDDPVLRRRVESLISSHNQSDHMVDTPLFKNGDAVDGDAIDISFLEDSRTPGTLGKLGQYEVVDILGRGATSIVLKARDPELNRFIATKVLLPEIASNAPARKRFIREARAMAAVSHPHVITIHAVDEHAKVPHLVMEIVEGVTLQEKINQEGSLEIRAVLRIAIQTAQGLAAAHDHGLIHRDVKPANILLENGIERVKVTDFGLARAVDDVSMTQSGYVAGTPQYMSPEQAEGKPLDPRSDLFSLGCALYAMCTGRSPFRADSAVAVLRRVCDDTPRSIGEVNPEVPPWLVDVIDKLLSKDPQDRFQSATEVAELLRKQLVLLEHPLTHESTDVDIPSPLPGGESSRKRSSGRGLFIGAAIVLALFAGLGIAELTGVTKVRDLLGEKAVSSLPVNKEHSEDRVLASKSSSKPKRPAENHKTFEPLPVLPVAGPTPYEILTSDEWKWTEPQLLGPNVNTETWEGSPHLSVDGLTLLFDAGRDLWMCQRKSVDEPFGERIKLHELCERNVNEDQPTMSADGLTLIFRRKSREGSIGDTDLWMSERTSPEDSWSKPIQLGTSINKPSPFHNAYPQLSPDGLTLTYLSYVPHGEYSWQLSRRPARNKPWSAPTTIASGNTGAQSEIWEFSSDNLVRISWTSRDMYLHSRSSSKAPWGGKALVLSRSVFGKVIQDANLSADGRTLMFAAHPPVTPKSDLWIMRRVKKP